MTLSIIASIIFFFFLFASSFFLSYLQKRYNRPIFGVLAVLIPAIVLAFRVNSGTDSGNYIQIYKDIAPSSLSEALKRCLDFSFEPFTIITIKIAARLGLGVSFYFFCHSIVSFIALKRASSLFSKENSWLLYGALVITMSPYCFNSMRQALATSLFILVVALILNAKKSFSKIILLSVLMLCCHFSSALCFPVILILFIFRHSISPKASIFIIVSSILLLLAFPVIFSFLAHYSLIPPKYLSSVNLSTPNLFNFDFAIFFFLSLILLYCRGIKNSFSDSANASLTRAICCSLLFAGFGFFSAYLGRISDYFWPIATIAIWFIIDKFKDTPSLKYTVFITSLILYFIFTCYVLGNNQLFPLNLFDAPSLS